MTLSIAGIPLNLMVANGTDAWNISAGYVDMTRGINPIVDTLASNAEAAALSFGNRSTTGDLFQIRNVLPNLTVPPGPSGSFANLILGSSDSTPVVNTSTVEPDDNPVDVDNDDDNHDNKDNDGGPPGQLKHHGHHGHKRHGHHGNHGHERH